MSDQPKLPQQPTGPYEIAIIQFIDAEKFKLILNEFWAKGMEYQGHSMSTAQGPPPLCEPIAVAIVVFRRRDALTVPPTKTPLRMPGKKLYGETG